MKKVLHVVYSMDCGGIENFIMSMFEQMKTMDLTFDFIYMNEEKTKCYFDDEIRKKGGNIYYVGTLNKKNLFKFIKNIKAIIKKNGPYDALHVHSFYNCGLISLIAKISGQKNIITHSHSTKDNKNNNSILRKIYRLVSKILILLFSDKNLACGIEAGNALYLNNKFEVINNGISTQKFLDINKEEILKAKKEFNINNETIITHVGNFYDVKNHDFIIKIGERLKKTNENFKILLLGDGSLKADIMKKVKANNLQNEILFLGLRNDVQKFLLLSDVFILPSKYEGFPVSLIEAQAAGLHCIVSNKLDKKVNLNINSFDFISINSDEKNIDNWCSKILHH